MKITIETIRDFLNQQSKHITHYLVTHYLVAHSNYSAYHKDSKDIEKMAFNLGKDLRRARNYFNKEFYGNGTRRKPLLL